MQPELVSQTKPACERGGLSVNGPCRLVRLNT